MDLLGSLLQLTAEQHNVVARRQALDLGISASTFDRWMKDLAWSHVGSGLWAPPGSERTPWWWLSMASLSGGTETLVTGLAALWAAGVNVPFTRPIRLVTPMRRHVNRTLDPTSIQVIASRTLEPSDATAHRRIPCAAPPRCFVDMVIPPTPALAVVRNSLITAVQTRITTLPEVESRARRAKGVPGRSLLLRAIHEVSTTGADSPFTFQVHRRLLREGLRPDPEPVPVETPGRLLHPDITFSPDHVGIECDSMLAHSEQRDIAVDQKKDRAYRDVGWDVLRIGWWEYHHRWSGFVADLRRALGSPR